jgi:hypothetical protein
MDQVGGQERAKKGYKVQRPDLRIQEIPFLFRFAMASPTWPGAALSLRSSFNTNAVRDHTHHDPTPSFALFQPIKLPK